ncbi:MAG: ABC-F family ATP-binding cassette domain-containing protein [Lentisphaeria bacterium]|nr:ABC-F family ATP-binding cassette domain-containing protein [Lentisphaeria bacterium]NQZ67802.1 ABC-F family ATP-binding cassette domain-containing protein [Lentisphaeria bacterium]
MIDFINVKKAYTEKDILKDASFRINKGERVGLVGPNGAGKSTILNMLTGDDEPNYGEITIPKDVRMGYLKQQLKTDAQEESIIEFTANSMPELHDLEQQIHEIEAILDEHSDMEILEKLGDLQNEYENLGGYLMQAKAEAALCGLGFHANELTRPLKSFSGGWQMRASLARTLIVDPDILLLDEPTNYLDVPAIEWLKRFLNNFKGTMLLISHDRFLLNSLCTVIIEVNAGLINRYTGNYDYYVKERESRFVSLHAAKENQDKKRQQLQSSIDRFRAKSSKATQVQSWVKALEKMEKIDIPDKLSYSGTIILPKPPACGSNMLSLDELGHSYDGEKWVFKGVNQNIDNGEKIGIIGYNGMGKSTLLKIIAGHMPPSDGDCRIGHNVVLGYQAQEFAEILPLESNLLRTITDAAPPGTTDSTVRKCLGSFGFSNDDVHKKCKVLSGGEKIRLAFARIFINPPNFLILDEPTTHLDISAREGLEKAIIQYEGTVCIVSHDIEFIKNTSNTIFAFDGKQGVNKYFGDYEYYLSKLAEKENKNKPRAEEKPEKKKPKSETVQTKEERKQEANDRKKSQKEQTRLETKISDLEKKIEGLETEKAEIVEALVRNDENTDHADLSKKLKDIDYSISLATMDWEERTEQLEGL